MKNSYPFDLSGKHPRLYFRKEGDGLQLWEPTEVGDMIPGEWYDCVNQKTGVFGQCCVAKFGDVASGKKFCDMEWHQAPPDWDTTREREIFILRYWGEFRKKDD